MNPPRRTFEPNDRRSIEPQRGSSPLSRAVREVDRATSKPVTAVVVAVIVVVFAIALAIAGFPETWETAFAAAYAAVTTIMVFTIQHTRAASRLPPS